MATAKKYGNTLRIRTSSNMSILRIIFVGGIGIIATVLLIKMIRKGRKVASGGRVTKDENVQIAMDLNTAIGSWYESANKDEIFRIADRITNYNDVASEYNNLYDESLSHELQNALGDDWSKFIAMVTKIEKNIDIYSDAEIAQIVTALHDDMSGSNIIGHDLELYQKLYRMPDSDFNKVISAYDLKYTPEHFASTLEGEWLIFGHPQRPAFNEFKEGILGRIV